MDMYTRHQLIQITLARQQYLHASRSQCVSLCFLGEGLMDFNSACGLAQRLYDLRFSDLHPSTR